MEFVRKVVDVTDLKNVIEIPNSLANKKVEILIFPIEEIKPKKKNKKSAAGMLSKYANSELISKEENVWLEEAHE